MKSKAFTLWTQQALRCVELATTDTGRTYGIGFYGEVWFSSITGVLYCHQDGGLDLVASMGRRNS